MEKVDKTSMAVGLEARVPFLDHELVEFAATVPTKYKIKGFYTKRIFKQAFHSRLPVETLKKPKHGFDPPLQFWFRDNLKGFVKEVLFNPRARSRGLLNYDFIETLYGRYIEDMGPYHWHLWLLIAFKLWCQQFLDHQHRTDNATAD